MKKLEKFGQLSSLDRRLLAGAVLLVAGVRIGLVLVSCDMLRSGLRRVSEVGPGGHAAALPTSERIGWAIRHASRLVPGAACLAQALAAEMLLRWYGRPALLQIGMIKTASAALQGHAWVECEGMIVVGGNVNGFTALSEPGSGS